MHFTSIGTTPRRRAPLAGGPTMEVLVGAETSDNIAMVQVWIPPDQPRNRTRRHDDRCLTPRIRRANHRLAGRVGFSTPQIQEE